MTKEKPKYKHKFCPILKGNGVSLADAAWGSEDTNWKKELCSECPLDKCVFDMRRAEYKKVLEDYN